MDLQDPESKWSYHRMACTENFVIFWEKGFGDNLSDPPQPGRTFHESKPEKSGKKN